jgi:bacteriocin-like protein
MKNFEKLNENELSVVKGGRYSIIHDGYKYVYNNDGELIKIKKK